MLCLCFQVTLCRNTELWGTFTEKEVKAQRAVFGLTRWCESQSRESPQPPLSRSATGLPHSHWFAPGTCYLQSPCQIAHRESCVCASLAETASEVIIGTDLLPLMILKHHPAGVNFPDHQITNWVTPVFPAARPSTCWLMRNSMKGRKTILGQQVRGAEIDSLVQSCLLGQDEPTRCKKNLNGKREMNIPSSSHESCFNLHIL